MPLFRNPRVGQIIMQAAQGIGNLVNQANQLEQQRTQFDLQIKQQEQTSNARAQELQFRERAIKVQEDQVKIRAAGVPLQQAQALTDLEISQAKLAQLQVPPGVAPLSDAQVTSRRKFATERAETLQMNRLVQDIATERRDADPSFRVGFISNGRAGLQQRIDSLSKELRDLRALPVNQRAPGRFGEIGDEIQRLRDLQKDDRIRNAVENPVPEDIIREVEKRTFGAVSVGATTARQVLTAPTALPNRIADAFPGRDVGTIDRALGAMERGQMGAMVRFVQGETGGLESGDRRAKLLEVSRVLTARFGPEESTRLLSELVSELSGQ